MESDNSSIERLKKKLYSRSGSGLGSRKRRTLRELSYGVRTRWKPDAPPRKPIVNKDKALSWLLIASGMFFVGSIALSAFFYFADRNTVSSSNIGIEIQGPATIGGGEELVLQILVTNKNPARLEDASLLIEYPPGTRVPDDLGRELPRAREDIGSLDPGESAQRTIRAVLFGEEDSHSQIKATVEYRVEGSNAIFYRDQTYDIVLSKAPLALLIDSVEEISSGQELEFTVTVTSNSDTILRDVLFTAEYPFGFQFLSATPQTFDKNNVWKLGDIKPEEEHTIRIRGTILGEHEEERVFRFSAGIANSTDNSILETAFVTALRPVQVEKPFIGVDLAVNGDTSSSPIVSRDGRHRIDITWFNNLPDSIYDAEIQTRVQGNIVDERSISAQSGFYSSSDDTVSWSSETLSSLETLDAGEQGTVSFSFSPLSVQEGETFRTPTITLDITIRGKRVSQSNVPEVVESTVQRSLKVETDLVLSGHAAHFSGPFDNYGSIPPQAEKETSYTIFWDVTNTTNPVGNVFVSASLPSYMRWVGAVSPGSASVEFNPVGGQIRWNIGPIQAHETKQVAFQVALSPSISQIGDIPVLLNRQRVEGIDTFTTRTVGGEASALTAQVAGDPGFPSAGGRVAE